MKLSCEIPVPNLEVFHKFMDYDFVLTHMIEKSTEYTNFYKQSSNYKILDNSAFELDEPVTISQLFEAGYEVGAHEIVLPDVMGDTEASRDKLYKGIGECLELYSNYRPKLVAVCHGETIEEFISYFIELYHNKHIYRICIPFHTYFVCRESETETFLLSRLKITQRLHHTFKGNILKKVHLLGASNPIEMKYQNYYPWIDSVDTSSPIQQAKLGIMYDLIKGVPEKKKIKVDFDNSLTEEEIRRAMFNLGILKSWCRPDGDYLNSLQKEVEQESMEEEDVKRYTE